MKILVTGADGFTGKHFVKLATSLGHEAVPLVTNLLDIESLSKEIHSIKPDTVVHLAAISYVAHGSAQDFYAVNTIGTTNLLDALLENDTDLNAILIASSANVYGNNVNSPILELEPASPVNHYAGSKLAMESLSYAYQDKLPLFITRPFNYTGLGQSDNFLIPKIVSHFQRKENSISLGNLDVSREFNDVRFVCNAYLKLLKHFDRGNIYNICTGKAYSLTDIIQILQLETGHKIKVEVNQQFVRNNEIKHLCGNPKKLLNTIDIEDYELTTTLKWMLQA